MSVITQEEYENLHTLADAIKNEDKRKNALALLERMKAVIEGVGDTPITWRPTMIKLLQAMSNMDGYEGNAKSGALVAGTRVLDAPFQVIPLLFWTSRSMWDSDKDSARKLCQSPDGKFGTKHGECKSCSFGHSEEGIPPCNKEKSILVIDPNFEDIYRITMHKSQYRAGLDWEETSKRARSMPYKRTYALSSENHKSNAKVKTFKVSLMDVRENSLPADEEAFLHALYDKNLNDRKAYLEFFRERAMKEHAPALEHRSDTGLPAPEKGTSDDGTPNYAL